MIYYNIFKILNLYKYIINIYLYIKMQWNKYNCAITTRHGIPSLYKHSLEFMKDIPYNKYILTYTTADNYLEYIIRFKYDWIINIDDDAFVTNIEGIYKLLKYMDDNNYDYCGMADGGFFGCRLTGNPCSMNPFFNIFNLKNIKNKINIDENIKNSIGIEFEDNLKNLIDTKGFYYKKEQCHYEPLQEPYYKFFFKLLKYTKPLFLQAKLHTDNITTILYNHEMKDIIYHTWYARVYNTDKEQHNRINNVIEYVKSRKEYDFIY